MCKVTKNIFKGKDGLFVSKKTFVFSFLLKFAFDCCMYLRGFCLWSWLELLLRPFHAFVQNIRKLIIFSRFLKCHFVWKWKFFLFHCGWDFSGRFQNLRRQFVMHLWEFWILLRKLLRIIILALKSTANYTAYCSKISRSVIEWTSSNHRRNVSLINSRVKTKQSYIWCDILIIFEQYGLWCNLAGGCSVNPRKNVPLRPFRCAPTL